MKRPSKIVLQEKQSLIVVEKNHYDIFQELFEKRRHVIPLFSLQDMQSGYRILDDKNKDYVDYQLSKSVFFYLALCPQDIQHKILTTMLDDDAESAKEYYKMPVLKAHMLLNRLKSLPVGNKVCSVGRLFRLSAVEEMILRK